MDTNVNPLHIAREGDFRVNKSKIFNLWSGNHHLSLVSMCLQHSPQSVNLINFLNVIFAIDFIKIYAKVICFPLNCRFSPIYSSIRNKEYLFPLRLLQPIKSQQNQPHQNHHAESWNENIGNSKGPCRKYKQQQECCSKKIKV